MYPRIPLSDRPSSVGEASSKEGLWASGLAHRVDPSLRDRGVWGEERSPTSDLLVHRSVTPSLWLVKILGRRETSVFQPFPNDRRVLSPLFEGHLRVPGLLPKIKVRHSSYHFRVSTNCGTPGRTWPSGLEDGGGRWGRGRNPMSTLDPRAKVWVIDQVR